MVGKQLSHYRIVAELGRGGMGIVYKAEDTKLDRTVAIKVLPPAALSNEDDRTRFYREAKAAAQLQHPNIASIYEIDEAVPHEEGTDPTASAIQEMHPFIAMEFIDGETLSERITTSPLKISEAVRIATGIADALKLAHSKDIVHRDIKSSNIMLDSEGRAKVLDFGLAKTAHSTMLTRMGSTIGTVAYMSPEQAKGEDVDSRTDLWALGVVMHELIVGRLPFGGDYEQAIVYSILNEQNEPLTAVRTGVPMELERIVNKMLSKQQDLRYQTAADLMADLKAVNLQASTTTMPAASTASMAVQAQAVAGDVASTESKSFPLTKIITSAVALIFVGLVGYFLGTGSSGAAGSDSYQRIEVVIPGVQNPTQIASSHDGEYWAVAGLGDSGSPVLFFYNTRTGDVNEIPNSAGMFGPSFSPDGSWLLAGGGTAGQRGKYRIQVPRGQPLYTFRATSAAWLDDRTLIADPGDSLMTIDIGSGLEQLVATPDSTAGYFTFGPPSPTSDPEKVLIAGRSGDRANQDLLMYDVPSGDYVIVEESATFGLEIAPGHIGIVKPQGDEFILTFAAFDLSSGLVLGPPAALEDPWSKNIRAFLGDDNTLFMRAGTFRFVQRNQIGWFDPEAGSIVDVPLETGNYDRVAISPSGEEIAIERVEEDAARNIITLNLETGSINRITYDRTHNFSATFGPVSGRIYFAGGDAFQDPASNIYARNSDGTGQSELIVENGLFPSISPDEKWLAFSRFAGPVMDIYAINLETKEIVPVDTSAGNQTDAAFSPDGKYILYSSREGRQLVISNQSLFIRSFPDTNQLYRKLSEELAIDDPVWASDGSKIFFEVQGQLRSIDVSLENGFTTRSRIRDVELPANGVNRAVSDPNSHRLLMTYFPRASVEDSPFDFHMIQNLPALLREVAPEFE